MSLRAPIWLWLAGLLVPLIVLYILRVRRRPVEVPSTRLWLEALRELEARTPFRRLRRSWLLLLEILVLALLVVAAAEPYVPSFRLEGSRSAIVIDASASMLAGNRIDRARREAVRLIQGMGPGDVAAVLRAGIHPVVEGALGNDRDALRRAVAKVEARPTPVDLEAALRLGRSLVGPEGELVLITDVSAHVPEMDDLRVVRVGQALPNVGIVALGVRRANPSGFDHQIFARLSNTTAETLRGTVELRVDGTVRDASSIELPSGEEQGVTLELVGVDEGMLEVRWRGDGADALSVDDRAVWSLRRPMERRFRLSSRPDPFLGQALAALEGWSEAGPQQAADVEIGVRSAPADTGPALLWIDPPEMRQRVMRGPQMLDWDRTHPVLRHVDLFPVRFGTLPVAQRPAGAEVLARTTAGPLILDGVRGERPYVAWVFDPLETDLPLRVAFPLLLQNSLEFLVPPSHRLDGGIGAGEAPVLAWSAGAAEVVSPTGARRDLVASGGRLHLGILDEVGPWRLVGAGHELTFGVSLLDPEESDLRARGDRPVPATPRRRIETIGSARELWRIAVLLGLATLLLEGWAFHRRWLA